MSSREVPVAFRPLAAEDVELAEQLRRHATMQDVLDWCRAQHPPRDLAALVIQDECTHDVVLQLGEHAFAVYDST